MAISQTMSNPNDWLSQSYHNTDFFSFGQTQTPPTTVAASGATASDVSRSNNMGPDHGRVTKPLRKRSRASRRTPTTLLNTDTANFRAMVQRFTGGPAAAYAAESQVSSVGGGGAINFMEHFAAAGGGPRSASGFSVQYPNQELLQQQMMFMVGGGGDMPPTTQGSASGDDNRSYENYML